jgi:hypothetical protein
MFSDYKVQVVDFYKKNRENGSLPLNLINPTPAKLKNESLLVFHSRGSKGDIGIIRQFFGPREDEGGYLKAIKTIDTDKFKPLVNFLKEQTQDTEDKNIELLAWLLDFKPRPYQFSLNTNILPFGGINNIINEGESKSEPIILLGYEISLPLKPWYQKKKSWVSFCFFIRNVFVLYF